MLVYLVRHGQTDYNKEGRIQGQMDVPLNKKGRHQAKETSKKLKNVQFAHAFSSDLKRAKQTAQIILENNIHNGISVKLDKRLREKQYGVWEGITWNKVHERHPKLKREINDRPLRWAATDGENMRQMFQRIKDFLLDLKSTIKKERGKSNQSKNSILVVSHNSPIRLMLVLAKQIPWPEYRKIGHISNTQVCVLEFKNDRFSIKSASK